MAEKAKLPSDVGLGAKPSTRESREASLNFLNQKDKDKETQIVPWSRHSSTHDSSSLREHQISSDSGPPSAPAKKATEEITTPVKPTTGPREVLAKRKVNGVWDSCDSTDLTVHLTLSAREDLDETLEEFCRLRRLGHFASAKQFFAENLQEHIERPQVLIAYAEMLLEQGDYNTLSGIDDDTMHHTCSNLTASDDQLLLQIYWKLIKITSAHYKPNGRDMLSTKRESFSSAVDKFSTVITANKRNITSTEIKILALLWRLCGFRDDPGLLWSIQKHFPPEYYKELYVDLLGEGRVWDFRDIAVASISSQTDNMKYWGDTRRLLEDWSRMTTDTSTTLALLDILVSHIVYELESSTRANANIEVTMGQSEPLALWIIENDPNSMKSRSFIRWMLAKAQYADIKGPYHAYSYGVQLNSWPGSAFHPKRHQLPQYVPAHRENPGWRMDDAAPRFLRPARLAVKIARELGDYETEAAALKRIISLSAAPHKEFEELCNLQSQTQGDVFGYSQTLVSKYLISNTEDLKHNLKLAISELFDIPNFCDSISMLDSWILNMLQYSLEEEGPAAQRILEGADEDYQDLPLTFRAEIDSKFPDIQHRSSQIGGRSPSSGLGSRFIRKENGNASKTPEGGGLGAKENHPASGSNDGPGQQKDDKSVQPPEQQHLVIRARSSKLSEDDDWSDNSYESGNPIEMTRRYAPVVTPQKERRSVSFLPRSRKAGSGLASGESSLPMSRATTSIFDHSKGESETATTSEQPIKPTDPIGQSGLRKNAASTPDEIKLLNTLDKAELIEYLRNKRPTGRKQTSPNERNPNTDGSGSKREERRRRPGFVSYVEDVEESIRPSDSASDEKLGAKREHEERRRLTVDERGNKDLESRDQNQGPLNEQLDRREKEARDEQKGKKRAHEIEEPQWLDETLMRQPEPKMDSVMATVESTEDLGENAGKPTTPNTQN